MYIGGMLSLQILTVVSPPPFPIPTTTVVTVSTITTATTVTTWYSNTRQVA